MNLKEVRKDLEVLTSKIVLPPDRKSISMSYLKKVKNEFLALSAHYGSQEAFDFGEELHRKILEPNTEQTIVLTDIESEKAYHMVTSFDKAFSPFLIDAAVEVDVSWGIFRGRIDILHDEYIADIKTTSTTTEKSFVKSLKLYDNFIQALLYMIMTNKDKFIFLGISKKKPYKTMYVDCIDYPLEMDEALDQLKFLITQI